MYRREDIEDRVKEFFKKEFPEIAKDAENVEVISEITDLIFDMLIGDFQEEDDEEES